MAYEASCKSYPEAMPALPEVPGGRYFYPSFHELEMEHVWKKSWIIVAHISEFDEIVSYRLFERLDPSIISVRSAGNQYRALHNVCRHRGAPLILQEQGTAKRFTCPYHAWTYNGDGTLIAVPDEKDFKCLDRRNRG